jgi:uncharacterized membrane protein YphA (DoxX/SURF4 family)
MSLSESQHGAKGIYVEIEILSPIDELWAKTQVPELHQRWDLRFTNIEYVPRPNLTEPQQFLYATRIGFGMKISGRGETLGTLETDGSRTSALKFWSNDPKSLIREGSGYWKYIPIQDGIRFLTWYDYTTRFGAIGRAFDAIVFRPLLSWATAWSFDRLRLWLDKQIDPSTSMRQSVIYAICRLMVAFVWLYQGLVPKLLFSNPDESLMLADAGWSAESIIAAVRWAGIAEIAFGVLLIVAWRVRTLFAMTIALMLVAIAFVGVESPRYLSAAFNPITLNLAMVALSAIGLLCRKDLPSASRCLRKRGSR